MGVEQFDVAEFAGGYPQKVRVAGSGSVPHRRPQGCVVRTVGRRSTIDCGGWNFQDSQSAAKKTVYGKIGYICSERGRRRSGIKPGKRPYICWNKRLWAAYVDWPLVTFSLVVLPFYLLLKKVTHAGVDAASASCGS